MRRGRETHHRPSLRLKGYDYAQAGSYFITVVTWQRECTFGDAVEAARVDATHALRLHARPSYADAVKLNEYGEIARRCWMQIPDHFPSVELDAFVIMPNHVHGIVVINGNNVDGTHASHLPGPKRGSIAAIVGSYKSAVSRRVNILRGTAGVPVWQTNYYEHVVRNERSLSRNPEIHREKSGMLGCRR